MERRIGMPPQSSRLISLKSFLFREGDEESAAGYWRIIDLLVQAITLHSVEGDKADHERFRQEMDQFAARLTPAEPVAELLVVVGGVVKTLEEYNRRTSKFVHQQNVELQNIVAMLTQTIITIGASSEASSVKLHKIEKSIEGARMIEDIQMLKVRLGECLEAVREEAIRQKAESRGTLEALQKEVEVSRQRIGPPGGQVDLDSATGLPGKREAEEAIQQALTGNEQKLLLVAVINRVQAVNARFGYAVGDQVLVSAAEHFRKHLSANDRLFRWHGPALVAVLERAERIDQVRAEVRRFADAKLDKTIEIGPRSVLIPISANWSVFAITPPWEGLLKRVETFTAAQMPKEYV